MYIHLLSKHAGFTLFANSVEPKVLYGCSFVIIQNNYIGINKAINYTCVFKLFFFLDIFNAHPTQLSIYNVSEFIIFPYNIYTNEQSKSVLVINNFNIMNMTNTKENLQEYASSTTLHGLRYVCGKDIKIVQRILWAGIVLAMLCGFCIQFSLYLIQFFRYESTVSITYDGNETLLLPAVTICDMNFVQRNKINKQYPEIQDLMIAWSQNLYSEEIKFAFLQLEDFLRNITFYDFIHNVGVNPEELFVRCQIGQVNVNCSDYIVEYNTDRGNCYTFNSAQKKQKVIKTNSSGFLLGYSLLLQNDINEYTFSILQSTGLWLVLHDQSSFPTINNDVLVVAPGKQTIVALQKETVKNLPKPYSKTDCIIAEEIPKQKEYRMPYPYSSERCIQNCIDQQYEHGLGCQFFEYGENMCTLYDYFANGGLDTLHQYLDGSGSAQCNCYPACDSVNFDIQITSTEFGNTLTEEYAVLHNWSVTNLEEMRSQYSEIQIFYKSMTYKTIEQKPSVSIGQLISSIGGFMGLYLGASLITVLEFISFLIHICEDAFCSKKNVNIRQIKVKHQHNNVGVEP